MQGKNIKATLPYSDVIATKGTKYLAYEIVTNKCIKLM